METNFIRLMAQAREAKRQLKQQENQENVAGYFQTIYKNIFKSGMRLDRVSQLMERVSEITGLQNKVLFSRVTMDLDSSDNDGKISIVMDDSSTDEDKLFKFDVRAFGPLGSKTDRLVISLNSRFPAPTRENLTDELTRYEERDVFNTVELLVRAGEALHQYGDELITRAEFRQAKAQA